jgi:hypothetical protein
MECFINLIKQFPAPLPANFSNIQELFKIPKGFIPIYNFIWPVNKMFYGISSTYYRKLVNREQDLFYSFTYLQVLVEIFRRNYDIAN